MAVDEAVDVVAAAMQSPATTRLVGQLWTPPCPILFAQSFTERLKAEGRDPSAANDTPEDTPQGDELPSIAGDAEDLSTTEAPEDGNASQDEHA